MSPYDNIQQSLESLRSRGFTNSFELNNKQIHCMNDGTQYDVAQIKIVEFKRYNTDRRRNPDSIVFALITDSGKKGILIEDYDGFMSMELTDFMSRAKVVNTAY